MASRIVAVAVLCFVTPNPGFGSGDTLTWGQTNASIATYSKVVALEKAVVVSTSVIRTSPVMAKPSVNIENGIDSSSVSSKPTERISTDSRVSATSRSTEVLSPSAVTPPLYVDEVSLTSGSVVLNSETLMSVISASAETETKTSSSISIETSAFESSNPMPHSPTKTPDHTVIVSTPLRRMSTSHVSESPTSSPPTPSAKPVDYKLILCVAVPLIAVLVFVIVIAMVLCIRRYRKLRRYRQHLVPLTDMDGSDDSDEDDQISDREPVFMVSSVNSSARPILSFENEND